MEKQELPKIGEAISLEAAAQNADRALELYERGFLEGALMVAKRTHYAINADESTLDRPRFEDILMVCEEVGLAAWTGLCIQGNRPEGYDGFVMHAQIESYRSLRTETDHGRS